MRFVGRRKALAGLAVVLLTAVPARAQATGTISGSVVDPAGSPLPGVSVTVHGNLIPEAATSTQVNGHFRFPALPPAEDYSLTFEMPGFGTTVQEGVSVRLGAETVVNVVLGPAGVKETVTVSGRRPVVDVKDSSTGANITEEYLQSIPSARDPWVMLEHTPGVQVDRQNIGGSESGAQSRFTAHGARQEDTIWTYDGAEVTEMETTGFSPMYYDFDALEEIAVTTGGNEPSVATGGVRINFVTRRGGNDWRGSGRFYVTGEVLQSDNVADPDSGELVGDWSSEELYPGYLGNSIDTIRDYGVELGGPLARDRTFVWGAYGRQQIDKLVGRIPDDTQIENWHAKSTWHVTERDVLNLTFIRSDKTIDGMDASPLRAPEATLHFSRPTPVYTGKYQRTWSDTAYTEATFNHTGNSFSLEPLGGRERQPLLDFTTGHATGSADFGSGDRPLYNARLDGNVYVVEAIGANHELKFGYSFRHGESSSIYGWARGSIGLHSSETPLVAWLIQDYVAGLRGKRHAIYAGDTIGVGRFTIDAGLRLDDQSSEALSSSVGAHPLAPDLFPSQFFAGFDPGFGWSTVSPRLGVSYAIGDDARTVFRASAGRFYSQMSSAELALPKVTTFGPSMMFLWNDADGDLTVDPGEIRGNPLFVSPGFDPRDPDAPSPNVVEETEAPFSDQIIVGVEHGIGPAWEASASLILRRNRRDTWRIPVGANAEDVWRPTLFDYGTGAIEVWEPVEPLADHEVYQQRPDYGTTYRGLELSTSRRFAGGWMANASLVLADSRQHYGSRAAYTDPTNIDETDGEPLVLQTGRPGTGQGTYFGTARWHVKVSGMVQLPAGLRVAGFFQARDGYVEPRHVYVPVRPNNAGGVRALVGQFGDAKTDTYWDLDLRLEKEMELADGAHVRLILDAFNVLDQDIVLSRFSQVNSTLFGRVTEVTQGRTVRLGVRLEFQNPARASG